MAHILTNFVFLKWLQTSLFPTKGWYSFMLLGSLEQSGTHRTPFCSKPFSALVSTASLFAEPPPASPPLTDSSILLVLYSWASLPSLHLWYSSMLSLVPLEQGWGGKVFPCEHNTTSSIQPSPAQKVQRMKQSPLFWVPHPHYKSVEISIGFLSSI